MKLEGECNLCGSCCVNGDWRCLNLKVRGRIGEPFATVCSKYNQRYDGMPIVMMNSKGKTVEGICHKDSKAETRLIVRFGFGRGCSLRKSG